MPPELLSAALLHSAHDGMQDQVFDPLVGGLAPADEALRGFVRKLEPELRAVGDFEAVEESATRLLRDGTGAERQRAAFRAEGMPGVRRLLDATIVADHGRSGEPITTNR